MLICIFSPESVANIHRLVSKGIKKLIELGIDKNQTYLRSHEPNSQAVYLSHIESIHSKVTNQVISFCMKPQNKSTFGYWCNINWITIAIKTFPFVHVALSAKKNHRAIEFNLLLNSRMNQIKKLNL